MARGKNQEERNTFVGGIVSDANMLSFPENASIDESNFEILPDGSRQRRKGLQPPNTLKSVDGSGHVDNYKVVESLIDDVPIYAVVVSEYLVITHDLSLNSPPFDGILPGQIADVVITGNKIYVVVDTSVFLYSVHVSATGVVDVKFKFRYHLYTRDVVGIEDGLGPTERPQTLSDEHKYNLHNQGWTQDDIDDFFTQSTGLAVESTNNGVINGGTNTFNIVTTGVYPSNSDSPWIFKDEEGNIVQKLIKRHLGSGVGESAKGKHIITVTDTNDVRMSESGLTSTITHRHYQFKGIAPYQGRMFYILDEENINSVPPSGSVVIEETYSDRVYFSKYIERDLDSVICHQVANPTSEEVSDVVATDGGYIVLSGANNILKIVPLEGELIAIADNGIWTIGSEEAAFSATGVVSRLISTKGCVNADSVVVNDDRIYYFSDQDIQVIYYNSDTRNINTKPLYVNSIDTLYREFALDDKDDFRINSYYNSKEKKVGWVRSSFIEGDYLSPERKLVELCHYNTFNAFTLNHIDIGGYVGDLGEVVTFREDRKSTYFFLGGQVGSTRLIESSQTTRENWLDVGVNDAHAFIQTSYEHFKENQRDKQIDYLSLHMKSHDVDSSVLYKTTWDYTNNSTVFKQGRKYYQGYRLRRGYGTGVGDGLKGEGWDIVTTKNRIRGSGRVFTFELKTEPGKECHLLGWSLGVSGSNRV